MKLDKHIVDMFTELTKPANDVKMEKTCYGTISVVDGTRYVKLDGSDLLVPAASTVKTSHGDRVTVLMKNHSLTVTGNLTAPATDGEGGSSGEAGTAATIEVGTVTTGEAGSSATVTNVGTTSAAVFDFVIPRGDKGEKGDPGPQGEKGDTGTWDGTIPDHEHTVSDITDFPDFVLNSDVEINPITSGYATLLDYIVNLDADTAVFTCANFPDMPIQEWEFICCATKSVNSGWIVDLYRCVTNERFTRTIQAGRLWQTGWINYSVNGIGSGFFVYDSGSFGDANTIISDFHGFVFNTANTPFGYCFLDVKCTNAAGFAPNGAVPIIVQTAICYNASQVAIRQSIDNGNSWSDWTLLSDGGNAATLGSHPASHFVQTAVCTTITTSINDYLTPGSYFCNSINTPDYPVDMVGAWGMLHVFVYGSICYQLLMTEGSMIAFRSIIVGQQDWTSWKRLDQCDGGNANTVGSLPASSFLGSNTNFNYHCVNGVGTQVVSMFRGETHIFAFNYTDTPTAYGFLDVSSFNGEGFIPAPFGLVRQVWTDWSNPSEVFVRIYKATSETDGTWTDWSRRNAASVGAYTEAKLAELEARIAALERGAI